METTPQRSNPTIKKRARDLGITFRGTPGKWNAITDVSGVCVGHTTLISGDGKLKVGDGPIRTGVTAILPCGKEYNPVFAAWYSLNGNGELTGTTWLEESGFLEGPIVFTNTHSVGSVRDSVISWQMKNTLYDPIDPGVVWVLPVVGETYDGTLNDINGQHIRPEHVHFALDSAQGETVQEGCVGGGTGSICHEFKGGIGTASRILDHEQGGYTVGVLVQANHGVREDLIIANIPVGQELADIPSPYRIPDAEYQGSGSILIAIATDAPLLPHQLKRLARRAPLGISRVGSHGEHYSGDIFIAFSTANRGVAGRKGVFELEMLSNDRMTPLFVATVQAVEEAIINTLIAAETMSGVDGRTAYAIPHERLEAIINQSLEKPGDKLRGQ